jgi:hypothetical protein
MKKPPHTVVTESVQRGFIVVVTGRLIYGKSIYLNIKFSFSQARNPLTYNTFYFASTAAMWLMRSTTLLL